MTPWHDGRVGSFSARTARTDALLAALERDGYAVVEGALEPSAARSLRAELDPLVRRAPPGRNAFEGPRSRHVYNLVAKTRAADLLVASPLALALCDELIGHHQLSAAVAVEIGPGAEAQELHCDDAVYPLPRPHDELVLTCLWALDDLDADGGATRVVAGSHSEDAGPARPVPLAAGSLLVHRGSLWHGGGPNRSGRPVRLLNLEYAASWLRPLETQLLAVPPELARPLPRVIQELVGYNTRPPFLGFLDGRDPRRILE